MYIYICFFAFIYPYILYVYIFLKYIYILFICCLYMLVARYNTSLNQRKFWKNFPIETIFLIPVRFFELRLCPLAVWLLVGAVWHFYQGRCVMAVMHTMPWGIQESLGFEKISSKLLKFGHVTSHFVYMKGCDNWCRPFPCHFERWRQPQPDRVPCIWASALLQEHWMVSISASKR